MAAEVQGMERAGATGSAGSAGDELDDALDQDDRRRVVSLLARRHGGALGRLCMALVGASGEAEEIVQESLLAVHAQLDTLRDRTALKAWLFGIARRKCAQHLTRRRRRQRLSVESPDAPVASDPMETVEARDAARRARAAIRELKPSDQELLVLRFTADLSYREVGTILDIDEPTARKRVSRALERLRQLMTETGR